MKKKEIRCYKEYANVYPGVYNYLVYFPTREGWSSFSFVTCINCGEIFVIDWENPLTSGKTITEIAGNLSCPTCILPLRDTLKKYPEYIKLPNGKIGNFNPNNFTSSEGESLISGFYEIIPT